MSTVIKRIETELNDRVKELEIEPCYRMNTESCMYSNYSKFSDKETNPLTYSVNLLVRCYRCMYRVCEL